MLNYLKLNVKTWCFKGPTDTINTQMVCQEGKRQCGNCWAMVFRTSRELQSRSRYPWVAAHLGGGLLSVQEALL